MGKDTILLFAGDGVEILYPEKPQIEGTNLITSENNHLSGVVKEIIKIASNQKEGYCEYLWDKPEEKEGSFKKLTYVKLFEPYNWIIGTGLYLDDMEKRVKDELVSNTDRLIFDKKMGSYIFMGTWEGVSLTYPAPNVDLYNLQDIHGKFPVRELIATAQSGGGFVEYEMPPLQGERPLRKLSYTTNLPQWKAYVGAGIYLNDIYEEIEKLNVLAKEEFKRSLLVIMWTILGFILFLFIVYAYINYKMKKDFDLFKSFFNSLVLKQESIHLEEVKFEEFHELAFHANAMLKAKIESDSDLKRYKQIVSNSNDLLAFIDKKYTFLAISEGYVSFFHKTREEILGKRIPELVGEDYFQKELEPIISQVLKEGLVQEREHWLKSPLGEEYYMHTKYFPYFENNTPEPIAYIVSARDMTEKKINEEKLVASEKKLEFLAHHDSLTHLPNRLLLSKYIGHTINISTEKKSIFAVCFMDLDEFKKINDSYGHSYGDEVLEQLAIRMGDVLREGDTLSRIGGDEFILIITNIQNKDEIKYVLERIQTIFKQPFVVKQQKFFLSASIGISLYPEHGVESEILIKNADTAMYRAKKAGKNTYTFYTLDMSIALYQRVDLENALRDAIGMKQFLVYYQPQVDLVTGELIGIEALVRWNHPTDGVMVPSRFIGLAEETRLIIEIGAFVLEQACLDLLLLKKENLFNGTVSINISGVQIEYSDFLSTLQNTIERTGIEPSCMDIEVTESFIMNDPEQWIELLKNMQRLGVTIAIDDFGTGHSSLSYLSKLPIDTLKVDMSFVKDVPKRDDACAIVNSIIDLAQNMKITTLAEGIETKEQESYLAKHGCKRGQGYLYGKPMCLQDLKLWMMNRQKESCKN